MENYSILNYIGSKKTLLNFIDIVLIKINKKYKNKLNNLIFFDGFSGTGIVGKYFNNKYKYITYSNDLEYYSYLINYTNLKINYSNNLKYYIELLDKLQKPVNEFNMLITNNYSPFGESKRMFWTIENANKCDAIMEQINLLKNNLQITNDEYIFLLSSLLVVMDKVANTACVYEAYLKEFKKTAKNIFHLIPIHTNENINNIEINKVFNLDINNNELMNIKYDIDINNNTFSIKSNKKGNDKVCPQKIGQLSIENFTKKIYYEITNEKDPNYLLNTNEIKQLILNNPCKLFKLYYNNLFCCDNLIYIKENIKSIIDII